MKWISVTVLKSQRRNVKEYSIKQRKSLAEGDS